MLILQVDQRANTSVDSPVGENTGRAGRLTRFVGWCLAESILEPRLDERGAANREGDALADVLRGSDLQYVAFDALERQVVIAVTDDRDVRRHTTFASRQDGILHDLERHEFLVMDIRTDGEGRDSGQTQQDIYSGFAARRP